MNNSDTWSTDKLLTHWLNPVRARALRQFQEREGLADDVVQKMAQITGRGYRPPGTVEGWAKMYKEWQRLGIFGGLPTDVDSYT